MIREKKREVEIRTIIGVKDDTTEVEQAPMNNDRGTNTTRFRV